jgi:HPt (histidine-containing phosphotransfer) domain-containing protein
VTNTTIIGAFDRDAFLDATGTNLDLIDELTAIFSEQAEQLLRRMHEAVAAGDAQTLRYAAHTLKGSAASFHAPPLYAAARNLEEIGSRADLSGADTATLRVESEARQLEAELRRWREALRRKPG